MNKILFDIAMREASMHENVVCSEKSIYTPDEINNLPVGTSVFLVHEGRNEEVCFSYAMKSDSGYSFILLDGAVGFVKASEYMERWICFPLFAACKQQKK